MISFTIYLRLRHIYDKHSYWFPLTHDQTASYFVFKNSSNTFFLWCKESVGDARWHLSLTSSLNSKVFDPFTLYLLPVVAWRSGVSCCLCPALPTEELIPIVLTPLTALYFMIWMLRTLILLGIYSGVVSRFPSPRWIIETEISSKITVDSFRARPPFYK